MKGNTVKIIFVARFTEFQDELYHINMHMCIDENKSGAAEKVAFLRNRSSYFALQPPFLHRHTFILINTHLRAEAESFARFVHISMKVHKVSCTFESLYVPVFTRF